MAYTNHIISAPVSISDVQAAVGHTSGDLATLILEGNINKWAKYKPVVYASVSSSNDGKGNVVNTSSIKQMYGLTVPITSDPFTTYKNGGGEWTYTRPSGGAASPYRLTDFDGYRSDATPPISTAFRKGQFENFNIFATAFIINFTAGNSLTITDFSSAEAVSGNIRIGAKIFQCPSGTKTDLNTWQLLGTIATTDAALMRKVITIADLANNHIYINDGSFYAFVLYLADNSQGINFTMPYDDNHYFAAMYEAKALPFFDVVSPYIWMLPDISVPSHYYQFTPTASNTYTPGSIPTTVYLRIQIRTYRGCNGLQRNLTFGSSYPDRVRFRINGRGDVFDGILVNSSGTTINSQTVNIRDDSQPVEATLYFKLTNVPSSLWNFGTGNAQTNYIYMYVSHDSGTTWQGLTNPSFTGIAFFK